MTKITTPVEKSKWQRRWEAFFEAIELGLWIEFFFNN